MTTLDTPQPASHRLQCSEIWGGFSDRETALESNAMKAALYSSACVGGKGGDIYYLSVCGADKLTRIVVADVTGHGDVVSGTSSMLYDAMVEFLNDSEGASLLERMNKAAVDIGFEAITTVAVIALYTAYDQLYFSYAGHHPALISRAEHRGAGRTDWQEAPLDPETETGSNLPLAIDPDATYDQQAQPIGVGDRILLYTDGVIEAPGADGQQFGVDGLLRVLSAVPADATLEQTKDAVIAAVKAHVGGELEHDDVTVVVIEAV
ncbi:MAG: PP2C family protein-serine/threonine phosphatase [Planctomycetota bacterium]